MLVLMKSLQRTEQSRSNKVTFSFIWFLSIIEAFSLHKVTGSCLHMFFQFIQVLQKEMDAIEKEKDKFISDFSEMGFYFLFLLFN